MTLTRKPQIILASNNTGKLRELQSMLSGLGLHIRCQRDFNITDVTESGLTFVENAILKARHASTHTGLPTIADDSGLEVDVLDGAPGIYSARYAGPDASDEQNVRKLLGKLVHVPATERTARFRCVIVFMRHAADATPLICQGTWEGLIIDEPRGTSGFGYDPVFFVPSHGCTAAELEPETKNRISHRGQALKELVVRLS